MTSPTTPLPERSPWDLVIGEGPFSVRALLSTVIGKHPFLSIIIADLESKYDESPNDDAETGEEVVDVAEYYGDSTIKHAKKISYHQLKHSYGANPWTLSALSKTLTGFFKRFKIFKREAEDTVQQTVDFTFTTNRRVAEDVHELLGRIREDALAPKDLKRWNQIKGYLNTDDDALAQEFFASFRIDDANDVHWKHRSVLIEELSGYMAGSDKEAADQLWRLVVDKASPEQASNPEITRADVLRFLNTDEDELFPAPCLIKSTESYFVREQEDEYLHTILGNDHNPVIIHAEGGVGKTALARRLCNRIPSHSVAVLYDCFSNGGYRNLTQRRDEHRVGLVPSNTIRYQTVETLKNTSHPYRQALNETFAGRVRVFDIADFTQVRPHDLRDNCCVVVGTIQTLRVSNTDGRKVYAHNEELEPRPGIAHALCPKT